MLLPLLSSRLPCTDDSNTVAPLDMGDEQQSLPYGMTNRDLSILLVGVVRVWVGHGERIEEHRRGLLDGHTMLTQVRIRLLRIRLILHDSIIASPALEAERAGLRQGFCTHVQSLIFFGHFDFIPHLVLMVPKRVGVVADELFHTQPIERRWSLHSLLLPTNEDGHVFLTVALLLRPLLRRQLALAFRHTHRRKFTARSLTPNVVPLRRGPPLAVAWSGVFGHRRRTMRPGAQTRP